jgi:hypothetical protein
MMGEVRGIVNQNLSLRFPSLHLPPSPLDDDGDSGKALALNLLCGGLRADISPAFADSILIETGDAHVDKG